MVSVKDKSYRNREPRFPLRNRGRVKERDAKNTLFFRVPFFFYSCLLKQKFIKEH